MLNISRVSVLPGTLEANTIYLVADGATGLQVTITGSTAAVVKSTRTSASITTEINNAVATVAGGASGDLTTAVTNLTNLISDEAAARVAGDAATLASANAYTDGEAGALSTALETETDERIAGDAATLAAANAYADGLNDDMNAAVFTGDGSLQETLTNAIAVAKGQAQDFATAADVTLHDELVGTINALDDAVSSQISALSTTMTEYTDTRATAAQAAAIAHADALVAGLDMSNTAAYALDIAARDALAAGMTKNSFVMVADASADATVDVGAALYFRNVDTNTWTKVAEYESMDIVIPNLDILADLGDIDGLLSYKGTLVATVQHTGSEW